MERTTIEHWLFGGAAILVIGALWIYSEGNSTTEGATSDNGGVIQSGDYGTVTGTQGATYSSPGTQSSYSLPNVFPPSQQSAYASSYGGVSPSGYGATPIEQSGYSPNGGSSTATTPTIVKRGVSKSKAKNLVLRAVASVEKAYAAAKRIASRIIKTEKRIGTLSVKVKDAKTKKAKVAAEKKLKTQQKKLVRQKTHLRNTKKKE